MRSTPLSSTAAPYLVVFVASACVMIVELVASRIIAQFVGSNLYTWTSIIAVVLAGISVGNLIGGRIAERRTRSPSASLAWALLLSSVATSSIAVVVGFVFDTSWLAGLSLPVRVLIGVTLSFFVPATLLGTVTPLAATWALSVRPTLGAAVGRLYALGSVGAIVGTLLTGFVLVNTFGSTTTIVGVAIVLALCSLLISVSGRAASMAGAALVVAVACGWVAGGRPLSGRASEAGTVLFAEESAYQTVAVAADSHGARVVVLDNLVHGYVVPTDPTVIVYPYIAVYAAAYEARRSVSDVPLASLHLGGGAYTLPRYIATAYPGDEIVVSEIDPVVTRANQVAAGLSSPPPFEVAHVDARELVGALVREDRRFDLVYADAFKDYSIPAHLATVEFYRLLDEVLEPGGLLLQNVIDDMANPAMLGSLLATVGRVHEHVAVISAGQGGVTPGRNTFVLVSSRRPIDTAAVLGVAQAAGLETDLFSPADVFFVLGDSEPMVLTDDFAPVESLVGHLYKLR